MNLSTCLASAKTIIKTCSLKLASKTGIGGRILAGIQRGKNSALIKFEGLEADSIGMVKSYLQTVIQRAPKVVAESLSDDDLMVLLTKYAKKAGLDNIDWLKMTQEEILETMLSRGGVGPCKIAQIISSDDSIMQKLSPKLQEIIKKTQSENPFSRTIAEAQEAVNKAFSSDKTLKIAAPNAQSEMTTAIAVASPQLPITSFSGLRILKPLSAGSVGESYLAIDDTGREVVVKMIKKNVDSELLEMEETLFQKFIHTFAPNKKTQVKHSSYIESLYKDWSKELDFGCEYKYNKMLQEGARRYKVADILKISADKSCIIMEKAEGIQMNDLMKILRDYKSDPNGFAVKYAGLIKENPWLANPDRVIKELPDSITRSFDEMFLFMKKGGKSIMHGDPHMGNYFITTDKTGKLIPMYIDTGNCVERTAREMQDDLKFLIDYFVGNSDGIAKYFLKMCELDYIDVTRVTDPSRLITTNADIEASLIKRLSKDIQKHIFAKNQNITDVDGVQKTIQVLLEKYGLSMKPEAATAFKAQMQFFTGITEAASLQGKVINVGTIVRDIPEAIWHMIKNRENPMYSVKEALSYTYNNQMESVSCIYQFLAPSVTPYKITTLHLKA